MTPELQREVASAIQAVVDDGSWSAYDGPPIERLAAALRNFFGLPHVHLCSSGTIGVELALRGVGVCAGDEVLLAGYDFPGNFRAIEAIGALPVVVDLAEGGHVFDAAQVEPGLNSAVRAVIVSHLHGQVAEVDAIAAVCRARQVAVVEDICQAPGGRLGAQPLGRFGDAAVLSFGGSKLLTAGRGGAVLTGDAMIQQRMRVFAHRGNDAFPLSVLQACVLPPQLAQLDEDNRRRREGAAELIERLREIGDLAVPSRIASGFEGAALYKLPLLVDGDAARRDRLCAAAAACGVDLGSGFSGFFRRSSRRCRSVGNLSRARRAAEQTCLLHHEVLAARPWRDGDWLDRLRAAVRRSKSA